MAAIAICGAAIQIYKLSTVLDNTSAIIWLCINILSGIIGFTISRFNISALRITQAFILITVAGIIISQSYDSYAGLWLLTTGVILLFKFGFFESSKLIRYIIISVIGTSIIAIGAILQNKIAASVGNFVLFACSGLLMYMIFELPHKVAVAKIKEQEKEIIYLQPLSKIGERGASIVHTIRNQVSRINLCSVILEENLKPTEEVAQDIKESVESLTVCLNGILAVSNSGHSMERTQFNISELINGACSLFAQDRLVIQHVRLNKNISKGVFVVAVKKEVLDAFENIIQNGVDAIKDTINTGFIDVFLNSNGLKITNNGGAIKTCAKCVFSCNTCPKYTKIGTTTKSYGSGNGITQVIATCNNAGWELHIKGYDNITSIEINFKETNDARDNVN